MSRLGPHVWWLPPVCAALLAFPGAAPDVPPESAEEARARHARVAQRRQGTHIVCHRGASEFAHENTLEAYRASLELGADGNEIDIRSTRDGILVCFHDDMLDRLLEGYGDVGELTWEELQRLPFRDPGRFGEHCRIPTLLEVLLLHRRHAGLLHLDIKRPGLDKAIAALLDRLDMWDHVAYCNTENGGVLLKDRRLKLRRYKAGLYLDRGEVDPAAIATALKKPGEGVIVDDPRGVLLALGRKLGPLSRGPVAPRAARPAPLPVERKPTDALLRTLGDAGDWNQVAETAADRARSGQRIRARARAAEALLAAGPATPDVFAALEERVRKRSLHKEWMYHGLDGAMSLRTLILLRAPRAVEVARFALWRDDPALKAVANPAFKNPPSWTDWRLHTIAFPALEKLPGAETEKLCRDYLALKDSEAARIGPPQFEAAARTLLTVSPRQETARELLRHRLSVVRGRAILHCLAHADRPWALAALKAGAPHALDYVVPR